MAAPIGLRVDFGGEDLRRLARGGRDAKQVRRLLALAVIHDGGSRSEAARMAARGRGSCGRTHALDGWRGSTPRDRAV